MVNELNTLESKIAQVVSLCGSLRAENTQLKEQLAAAESSNKDLSDRMESARGRLEQIVRQLPETKARA